MNILYEAVFQVLLSGNASPMNSDILVHENKMRIRSKKKKIQHSAEKCHSCTAVIVLHGKMWKSMLLPTAISGQILQSYRLCVCF